MKTNTIDPNIFGQLVGHVVTRSEVVRWTGWSVDAVYGLESRNVLPTSGAGRFAASVVIPHVLSKTEPGTEGYNKILSWVRWLTTGEKDDWYAPDAEEKKIIEAQERERSKTPKQRFDEASRALASNESSVETVRRAIRNTQSQIEQMNETIRQNVANLEVLLSDQVKLRDALKTAEENLKAFVNPAPAPVSASSKKTRTSSPPTNF